MVVELYFVQDIFRALPPRPQNRGNRAERKSLIMEPTNRLFCSVRKTYKRMFGVPLLDGVLGARMVLSRRPVLGTARRPGSEVRRANHCVLEGPASL